MEGLESAPGSAPSSDAAVKILFVASAGRSGSTLLDRLLGTAAGAFSGGELVDIWSYGVLSDRPCACGERFSDCLTWETIRAQDPDLFSTDQALKLDRIKRQLMRARYEPLLASRRGRRRLLRKVPHDYFDSLTRLYSAIAKGVGARVIVDSSKSPIYALLLQQLRAVDLKLFHLVRDPRAVVYSRSRKRPDPAYPERGYMLVGRPFLVAMDWVTREIGIGGLRTLGVEVGAVRYEDLVRDVGGTSRQLLQRAGIDGQVRDMADRSLHSLAGNPMRFAGAVAITPDDEWQRALPWSHWAQATALTLPWLLRNRYRPDLGQLRSGRRSSFLDNG